MNAEQDSASILADLTQKTRDAIFSSDGDRVFVAEGGAVNVYDVGTGERLAVHPLGRQLGALDVSADGRFLVAAEEGKGPDAKSFYRLDLNTGEVLSLSFPGISTCSEVAFASDGSILLASSGKLYTFDFKDFSHELVLDLGTYADISLTASAGRGRILIDAFTSDDLPLFVYTAEKGITASHHRFYDPYDGASLRYPERTLSAISPDGRWIVSGYGLEIFDTKLNSQVLLGEAYPWLAGDSDSPWKGAPRGLVFNATGDRLFVLHQNTLVSFDTQSWRVIAGYTLDEPVVYPDPGADDPVQRNSWGNTLEISPDGKTLKVYGQERIVLLDLDALTPTVWTSGDDQIRGTGPLFGFDGDDTLTAIGKDSFLLYGGQGNDTYYLSSRYQVVMEYAGQGYDTVYTSFNFDRNHEAERIFLSGRAKSATGNDNDNVIVAGTKASRLSGRGGDDDLRGGVANDLLRGEDGDDRLSGGAGNDRLEGGSGIDRLYGGDGEDTLVDREGRNVLNGGAGNDTYWVGAATRIIERAGGGHDVVHTDAARFTLADEVEDLKGEGAATQKLTGNALGNRIIGSTGNTTIHGLDGNDLISGGGGNDVLLGGAGADEMTGGAGADRFVFATGDLGATITRADRITDFNAGAGDRIDLSDVDAIAATPTMEALHFIGIDLFSGSAGELRYRHMNGQTLVQGDTDGDKIADFVIRLDGEVPLTEAAFVLHDAAPTTQPVAIQRLALLHTPLTEWHGMHAFAMDLV
jgi:Ca2+-binding RTX toxin-like protein